MNLKKKFSSFKVYYVLTGLGEGRIFEEAERILEAGADVLQLRLKEVSTRAYVRGAVRLKKLCAGYGIPFIVNDRVDVVMASGADGVHLGPEDMDFGNARRILGREKIIGLSSHSLSQAKEVISLRPDYFSVGPVFSTPTKSGNPPLGTEILARVGSMAGNIPWLAVGGINLQNLGDMRKCGASRVALVRALRESRNPGGVIKKVKRILENRTGMEQKR